MVRISIAEDFSSKYGEGTLGASSEHQRKFPTVRAAKDVYKFFELNDVPIQIDSEFTILIRPKTTSE